MNRRKREIIETGSRNWLPRYLLLIALIVGGITLEKHEFVFSLNIVFPPRNGMMIE